MEEFFKELMSTANPKYLERSMAHKSPKDLEDVCICTVVPTKSDSDVILCLQLLSKILT